ncbi:MAG: hypothetical protein WB558_07240 [Terriglobales bacterium]
MLGPKCTAAQSLSRVPTSPGYYTIFIHDGGALPSPYCDLLRERDTRLIYVGIATVSLYGRLVEQDLQHRRASSFFRGIGSVLGYRPPPGSLVGRANQNNYRFSAADTTEIIEWISGHLSVDWAEADPALETTEASLIRAYRPILNTKYNPAPVSLLAALRNECRRLAGAAG